MTIDRHNGKRIYKIKNFCEASNRFMLKQIFRSFFVGSKINQRERHFDVELNKTVKSRKPDGTISEESIYDYVDMKDIKEYFGNQWKFKFSNQEEA